MSTSPDTLNGENSDEKSSDSAPGIKKKNSDVLDTKSLPQLSCNGEKVGTSSDQVPSSSTVQGLHSAPSEPVFSSCESPLASARPRAKSVPTIVEQQVALFLRTISDDINHSYGNRPNSQNATDRNRRASYPGNIHLQEALSPLLRAIPMGIRSSANFQRRSASGSQEGTAITSRRIGSGAHHSNSSMDSVPEEGSDSGSSGDEV